MSSFADFNLLSPLLDALATEGYTDPTPIQSQAIPYALAGRDLCGIAQTGILTKAGVAKLLKSLPEGTTELMCHPGYVDDDLRNSGTRRRESRQVELEILTDTYSRKSIADLGIRLINYAEIAVPGR